MKSFENNLINIKTPFGTINSFVSLSPIIYLFFFYSIGLIFPWEIWNGRSLYYLWADQEYLAEHFQFIFFLSSSILAGLNIFKNKYKIVSIQNLFWFIFLILSFFIAIEEISFIHSFKGEISETIRSLNTQNELNFHNLKFIQPYLKDFFIFFNLFCGWFGWKYFPKIEACPTKFYSLYFLFTALAYTIYAMQKYIRYSFFFIHIPIHQEIFEFLTSLGLFLHSLRMYKIYSK